MKTNPLKKLLSSRIIAAFYVSVFLITSVACGLATDGSWNVDADGTWSTPGNWLGNIVADGPGSTAFFTNDITAPRTITITADQTIGNLNFGDADAASTPGGWIVTGNNLILTNSIAAPVITVTPINTWSDPTNDVQISSRIISGQGFVKKGTGTLTLMVSNVLGDSVRIDEGILFPMNAGAISTGNRAVIFNGGGVRVYNGGPALGFTNQIQTSGTIISINGNYDSYNGPFIGSGTLLISSSTRLTLGGGAAGAFAGFTGTIDLTDSTSGNNTRINLGSGAIYDMRNVTLNCGTNAGRFSFRTPTTPSRVLIGALSGGPNSRLQSSEQGGCTSLYWEIGYLNTSTTFEGTIRNYNGMADRVGHVVKVGTGKLTLTGSSDYTGITVISNGVLALAGAAALTGPTNYITVMSGAAFDVSGLSAPFSLSALQTLGGNGVVTGDVALVAGTISPGVGIGTLSFSNNLSLSGDRTVTNRFEIAGPGTSDLIAVAGNLTLSDTVVVRVAPTGPVIPNGLYPLIKWGGTLSGDIANLLLEYPAQEGTLTLKKDTAGKQIYLEVTGVPGAADLTWRGDGGANNWDLSTANWWNGSALTLFRNGDNAIFDDSGSNNVPVNIAVEVNPAIVFVNAAKDYVFASSAAVGINGSATLIKSNVGRLTLATDNNYSGPTVIGGGTVQVGDGVNAAGSLGSGNITNNAVLIYNRPDNVTNNSLITGTGVLVQRGTGTLVLGSANTYSGGTIISNGGTIHITTVSALGTGTLTLAGGTLSAGSLNINNALNVTADSTITSSGTLQLNTTSIDGSGTLALAGTIRFNAPGLTVNCPVEIQGTVQSYNITGEQVFNGVISGSGMYQRRWTDSNPANTGTTIFNAQNTYSGGTMLREGSIGFGVSSISDAWGSIISGPIGTGSLNQDTATYTAVFAHGGPRTVANPINLNPSGQAFIIKGTNDLTLSGAIDLGGVSKAIQVENTARTILTGDISNGELVKTGPGVLYVNGNNNASSNTVSVGTLAGTGVHSGPVTVLAEAVLAPGMSVGTLTIQNDFNLAGTLLMELDRSQPVQKNDTLPVAGAFNASTGTLLVTNIGPALVPGDSFQLFSTGRTFGKVVLPTNDVVNKVKYTWTDTIASNGRITVQSVAPLVDPTPTNIALVRVGNTLELSWPMSHIGWTLQSNSVSVVATNQWFDYPPTTGSRDTNRVVITIDQLKTNVFFRLMLR